MSHLNARLTRQARLDLVRGVAGGIGIPVIDWRRWIAERGRRIEDARWQNETTGPRRVARGRRGAVRLAAPPP